VVTVRQNWGEERVYYHDASGRLCLIPLAWTSLAGVDPFVEVAAGRALFHPKDLLRLAAYVGDQRTPDAEDMS
jgi:hypothetical protein